MEKFLISFLFLFLLLPYAHGQTIKNADISISEVWDLANSPYHVTSSITIQAGVTVSIQPGVVVSFSDGVSLTVSGSIEANGLEVLPITFNALSSSWNGITFTSSSIGSTYDTSNNFVSGSNFQWTNFEDLYSSGSRFVINGGSCPYINHCNFSFQFISTSPSLFYFYQFSSSMCVMENLHTIGGRHAFNFEDASPNPVIPSHFLLKHSLIETTRDPINIRQWNNLNAASTIEIVDVTFDGWTGTAITAEGGEVVIVRNSTFIDGQFGTFIESCSQLVENSYFDDGGGIHSEMYAVEGRTTAYFHAFNNTIRNTNVNAFYVYSYYWTEDSIIDWDIRWEDNLIEDISSSNDLILFYSTSTRNTFLRNTIRNCDCGYIFSVNIYDTHCGPLKVQDNVFEYITSSSYAGMYIGADWEFGPEYHVNSSFSNNIFRNITLTQGSDHALFWTSQLSQWDFTRNVYINVPQIIQEEDWPAPETPAVLDFSYSYWDGMDNFTQIRDRLTPYDCSVSAFSYLLNLAPWYIDERLETLSSVDFITPINIASSPPTLSGLISSDLTIPALSEAYLLQGCVYVEEGVTLTIEPGTQINVTALGSMGIGGQLISNGTPESPIIFRKAPSATSNWGGLRFGLNSANTVIDFDHETESYSYVSGSSITYTHFYGGGDDVDYVNYDMGALNAVGTAPFVENCHFEDCHKACYYFDTQTLGSVQVVANSTFVGLPNYWLLQSWARDSTTPIVLHYNTFIGGGPSYAVWINQGYNLPWQSFKGLVFRDAPATGLYLYYPSGQINITDSVFENCAGHGFRTNVNAVYTPEVTFSNNLVAGSGQDGVYAYVIGSSDNESRFHFAGNHFESNAQAGIDISASSTSNRAFSVYATDNTFTGLGGANGLDIDATTGNVIVQRNTWSFATYTDSALSLPTCASCSPSTSLGVARIDSNSFLNCTSGNSIVEFGVAGAEASFSNNLLLGNNASSIVMSVDSALVPSPAIYHNSFENPATTAGELSATFAGATVNATYNYWNSADNAFVTDRIVDFLDQPSLGVVDYFPYLTSRSSSDVVSGTLNVPSFIHGSDLYGQVGANEVLTLAGSPYRITAGVQVLPGFTLTIEAGVEICIEPQVPIRVDGELLVLGTSGSPVQLLPCSNDPDPAISAWGNIVFSASSTPALFESEQSAVDLSSLTYLSGSTLQHVIIRNAGRPGGVISPLFLISSASVYFEALDIQDISGSAFSVSGSASTPPSGRSSTMLFIRGTSVIANNALASAHFVYADTGSDVESRIVIVDTSAEGFSATTSRCVDFQMTGSLPTTLDDFHPRIHLNGLSCNNFIGEGVFTPSFVGSLTINGCSFNNTATPGSSNSVIRISAANYSPVSNVTITNNYFGPIPSTGSNAAIYFYHRFIRIPMDSFIVSGNTFLDLPTILQMTITPDYSNLLVPQFLSNDFQFDNNIVYNSSPMTSSVLSGFSAAFWQQFSFSGNTLTNRSPSSSVDLLYISDGTIYRPNGLFSIAIRNNTLNSCGGASFVELYLSGSSPYGIDTSSNTFNSCTFSTAAFYFRRMGSQGLGGANWHDSRYNVFNYALSSSNRAYYNAESRGTLGAYLVVASHNYWGTSSGPPTNSVVDFSTGTNGLRAYIYREQWLTSPDNTMDVNVPAVDAIDTATGTLQGVTLPGIHHIYTSTGPSSEWTITDDFHIAQNSVLIIHEGVTIRAPQAVNIHVLGQLRVLGLTGNPVTFSHTTLTPISVWNNWGSIYFYSLPSTQTLTIDGSDNYLSGSIFEHFVVEKHGVYREAIISQGTASPFICHGSFSSGYYGDIGFYQGFYPLRLVVCDTTHLDTSLHGAVNFNRMYGTDVILNDLTLSNVDDGFTLTMYPYQFSLSVSSHVICGDVSMRNVKILNPRGRGIVHQSCGDISMNYIDVDYTSSSSTQDGIELGTVVASSYDDLFTLSDFPNRTATITNSNITAVDAIGLDFFQYRESALYTLVFENNVISNIEGRSILLRCFQNFAYNNPCYSAYITNNLFTGNYENAIISNFDSQDSHNTDSELVISGNRFISNGQPSDSSSPAIQLYLNHPTSGGVNIRNNFFEGHVGSFAVIDLRADTVDQSRSFIVGNSFTSSTPTVLNLEGCNFEVTSNVLANPVAPYELVAATDCSATTPINATLNYWAATDLPSIEARVSTASSTVAESVTLEPFLTAPVWTCANDCSNNGVCVLQDFCECSPGYAGSDCSSFDCSGAFNCNAVNGGGSCVGANTCSCAPEWSGQYCLDASCPALNECNGNGFCSDANVCSCGVGFAQPDCGSCEPDFWGPACQPCPSCTNGGICDLSNGQCICPPQFDGDLCDECSPRFYGPTCENITVVLSVLPNQGFDTGGQTVTIIGDWFASVSECRFGSLTVPATYISETELKCVAPSQSAGSYSVEVTSNRGGFTSGSGVSYSYIGNCPVGACNNNGICAFLACVCDLGWTDPSCSTQVFAPTIDAVASAGSTLTEGDAYSETLGLSAPTNAAYLTWSLREGPSGASIDSSTGELSWPVAVGSNENIEFRVRASNEIGFDEIAWTITVPLSYSCQVDLVNGFTAQGSTILISGSRVGSVDEEDCVLWIQLRGTYRTFTLSTVGGSFLYAFTPSINEAGLYTVGARHPGDSSFGSPDDSFELFGLAFSRYSASLTLSTGPQNVTNFVRVRNVAENTVTGLTWSLDNVELPLADSLYDLTLTGLPTSLAPFEEVEIDLFVFANVTRRMNGLVMSVSSSTTGASRSISLNLDIREPKPIISFSPTSLLNRIVLRGYITTFSIRVTNTGTATSGTLVTALPGPDPTSHPASLSAGSQHPGLAPGESFDIIISVNPAVSFPLVNFGSNLVVSDGTYGNSLGYSFAVSSDVSAVLQIIVEDEYTYFTGEDPPPLVEDVTIRLLNLVTRQQYHISAPNDGTNYFIDIPEGSYNLRVSKLGHSTYSGDIVVEPGDNIEYVFLPRTSVSYTWTVTPTEIEDVYTFTLEADFETFVPLPVITIDPATINIEELEKLGCGQESYLTFTITNHGLIAAESAFIEYPDHPFLDFIQVVDDIGDVNATSSVTVPVIVRRNDTACPANYCGPHGSCSCEGECVCDPGYYGARCEIPRCNDGQGCGQGDCDFVTLTCVCDANHVVDGNGICIPDGSNPPTACPAGDPSHGFCDPTDNYRWTCQAGFGGRGCSEPICPGSLFPQRGQCNEGGIIGCIDGFGNAPYCNYLSSSRCFNGRLNYFLECRGYQRYSRHISFTKNGPCYQNNPLVTTSGGTAAYGYASPTWWYVGPTVVVEDRCAIGCVSVFNQCVRGRYTSLGCGKWAFYSAGWTRATSVRVLLTTSVQSAFCPVGDNGLRSYWKARQCQLGLGSGCEYNNPWGSYLMAEGGHNRGGRKLLGTTGLDGGTDPELAAQALVELTDGIEALGAITFSMFGADEEEWLAVDDFGWANRLSAVVADNSDAGVYISEAERQTLLSSPAWSAEALAPVSGEVIDRYVSRWNRTFAYLDAGITTEDQVEVGVSLDFVGAGFLANARDVLFDAEEAAVAAGYTGGIEERWLESYNAFVDAFDAVPAGVCASVTIRIEQELTLTRTAFEAKLEISNEESDPLTNISVEIEISELPAEFNALGKFAIRSAETGGGLSGAENDWTLDGNSQGEAVWLLTPTRSAAPGPDSVYYAVGGTLSYTINGFNVTVPLFPDTIEVYPDPLLAVTYFWPREVYSDDPFTSVIEPAVPFSLGLLISNNGYGRAKNVRIASGQPEIIDNDKGLLVEFQIIEAQAGFRRPSPSLRLDLGDIEPGFSTVARWSMTSSLQGVFSNFNATFEHETDLGDVRLQSSDGLVGEAAANDADDTSTSLIDSVVVIELTQTVRINTTNEPDDELPDFLANEIYDPDFIPDTLYSSEGGMVHSVEHLETIISINNLPQGMGVVERVWEVSVDTSAESALEEWCYIRIIDPELATSPLIAAKDHRGNSLDVVNDNVWRTPGRGSFSDKYVHILAHNVTGLSPAVFSLTFTPVNAVTGLRVVAVTNTTISIEWNADPFAYRYRVGWTYADKPEDESLHIISSNVEFTQFTFAGLYPGVNYQLWVFAGAGEFEITGSSVSTQTNGTEPNICEPECCIGGGVCEGGIFGLCGCDAGYEGEDCCTPICSPGCLNGGTCVAPDTCDCPTGTVGPICEREVLISPVLIATSTGAAGCCFFIVCGYYRRNRAMKFKDGKGGKSHKVKEHDEDDDGKEKKKKEEKFKNKEKKEKDKESDDQGYDDTQTVPMLDTTNANNADLESGAVSLSSSGESQKTATTKTRRAAAPPPSKRK